MENEDLNELIDTFDITEEEIYEYDSFENYKTDIVTTIAYLLGIKDCILYSDTSRFNNEKLEVLLKNNNANINKLNIGNWNGTKIESIKLDVETPRTKLPYNDNTISIIKIILNLLVDEI